MSQNQEQNQSQEQNQNQERKYCIDKFFNSIDNKHQVEITIIDDDICWFNICKIDFESFKTFLILLKDVMTYLKKNNVIYIKQNIFEEDIVYFKKSSIINLDEKCYIATTNIIDFIDEIVNVLDIKKL